MLLLMAFIYSKLGIASLNNRGCFRVLIIGSYQIFNPLLLCIFAITLTPYDFFNRLVL